MDFATLQPTEQTKQLTSQARALNPAPTSREPGPPPLTRGDSALIGPNGAFVSAIPPPTATPRTLPRTFDESAQMPFGGSVREVPLLPAEHLGGAREGGKGGAGGQAPPAAWRRRTGATQKQRTGWRGGRGLDGNSKGLPQYSFEVVGVRGIHVGRVAVNLVSTDDRRAHRRTEPGNHIDVPCSHRGRRATLRLVVRRGEVRSSARPLLSPNAVDTTTWTTTNTASAEVASQLRRSRLLLSVERRRKGGICPYATVVKALTGRPALAAALRSSRRTGFRPRGVEARPDGPQRPRFAGRCVSPRRRGGDRALDLGVDMNHPKGRLARQRHRIGR